MMAKIIAPCPICREAVIIRGTPNPEMSSIQQLEFMVQQQACDCDLPQYAVAFPQEWEKFAERARVKLVNKHIEDELAQNGNPLTSGTHVHLLIDSLGPPKEVKSSKAKKPAPPKTMGIMETLTAEQIQQIYNQAQKSAQINPFVTGLPPKMPKSLKNRMQQYGLHPQEMFYQFGADHLAGGGSTGWTAPSSIPFSPEWSAQLLKGMTFDSTTLKGFAEGTSLDRIR